VTVICAHHSRKGSTGDTADDIRGASAFVDALRFAATLAVPSPDQAKKMALDDDERRKMVRFNVVKSNYRTEVDTFWMRRAAGGVLEWVEPPAIVSSVNERAEARYRKALPMIIEKVKSEQATTRESLKRYAGAEGIFGMGDKSLRACITRAIDEGHISQADDGTLCVG
jgi:putative DNA primase/helicase